MDILCRTGSDWCGQYLVLPGACLSAARYRSTSDAGWSKRAAGSRLRDCVGLRRAYSWTSGPDVRAESGVQFQRCGLPILRRNDCFAPDSKARCPAQRR
jgi:hypothetical protein